MNHLIENHANFASIALCVLFAMSACKKNEFKFPNGEMKVLKAGDGKVSPNEGEYALAHVAMIEDGKVLRRHQNTIPKPNSNCNSDGY